MEFEFSNDWPKLLRPFSHNWVNFTLIHIEPEWDRAMGTVRLDLALLGFNFCFSWLYDEHTPAREHLKVQIEKLKAGTLKAYTFDGKDHPDA